MFLAQGNVYIPQLTSNIEASKLFSFCKFIVSLHVPTVKTTEQISLAIEAPLNSMQIQLP
jgi:hypothetical protein